MIADAQARYRRARGEDVLFALGLDTFGTSPKPADGQSAEAWIDERCAAIEAQLDAAGVSFDGDRSTRTSDSDFYRWAQWLFTKLLDADLVYQQANKGWFLRSGRFDEENDRRLDELDGWDKAVRDAQRTLLHRVDGYELEAKALDGTPLSLFTAHADKVTAAEFVALSPQRPELDSWLEDPDVRGRVEKMRNGDWADKAPEELPVVEVGMSVQVPSVAAPLPVVVSPAVDVRFGPAAVLGIPDADPADKALAKGLPKLGGLAWKVESKPPKTTPAVRYLGGDMPLSRGRAWGAPVPVVHCDACGAVPVSEDQLPLAAPAGLDVTARDTTLADAPDFAACECPKCGGTATRDRGTLHPRFTAALGEVVLALPASDRTAATLRHDEPSRRLPTARTIADGGANGGLLDMRTIAKALRDVGGLELADGEPHGPTLMHGELTFEDATAAALLDQYGSDAVRCAILNAAAPQKTLVVKAKAVEQAAAFLDQVRSYAESRLEGSESAAIDDADGLRRRLAKWCDTATVRMAENYEQLDMHRATRNATELLSRLQDFERRVVEYRGEVAGADRDALAVATRTLLRLLAPIAPALSASLIEGPADWPTAREPAAA